MSFFRIGACKISSNVKFNSSAVDTAYVAPTGGTITTSGNYRIHTFNADGTFTVAGSDKANGYRYYKYNGLPVEYVIVAGGAGGGGNSGGGGGAGGYNDSSTFITGGASSSITIGGGGTDGSNAVNGGNGTNTVFGSIGIVTGKHLQ